MKTFSLKSQQITKNWLLIDADKAILGRLAVISANILRGKNKPVYTPNQDCGDNLIIINSDKVALTGKKQTGRQQLSNCKIYSGPDHSHQAQNPVQLDISKLNKKNIFSK